MSHQSTSKHTESGQAGHDTLAQYALDYPCEQIGISLILKANCFEWLARIPENSLHGIVTDPPYGVKEYTPEQLEKRANGTGGVWRIPPSFDGHTRAPLPRFTALNKDERESITEFFTNWSGLCARVLRPGAHVFLASNAYLSQLVFSAMVAGGLEFRGDLIRLVRTIRGGDRPKNAEDEFPGVCALPRGCYEPWGIFRKPIPKGMTVGECLRKFETGGLRRPATEKPFCDVIISERTSLKEREITGHPSAKPQGFLREVVHAVLPLGKGILADPFMGSGTTVAAANALGLSCIGVEIQDEYYQKSIEAIPVLACLKVEAPANQLRLF